MVNQDKIKLLLNRLNYDFNTFKIGHFIHHVEGYRQRKILTIPYPFSPGISGAWVPGKLIEFVFFQSQTHVMHQNHIILHELAHMLLDHPLHRIDQILPPELLNQLGNSPDTHPPGHLRSFEVTRSKDVYEQEAEYFVTLIQRHVVRVHRLIELTTGDSSIADLKPFVQGLPFQDEEWGQKP